jgi:hypothetical protein
MFVFEFLFEMADYLRRVRSRKNVTFISVRVYEPAMPYTAMHQI